MKSCSLYFRLFGIFAQAPPGPCPEARECGAATKFPDPRGAGSYLKNFKTLHNDRAICILTSGTRASTVPACGSLWIRWISFKKIAAKKARRKPPSAL
jgi:hypothetical protein